MYLVAGLGNPGEKYKYTRHNMGFLCIDYISQCYNIPMNRTKFNSIIGEGFIGGEKVILAKPQTYMNLSGESVRAIVDWYKIHSDSIIILYDDINLDTGKIRIRQKGSDGGHNGVKSIINNLNTNVFPRIKIGIGEPDTQIDLANFVLSKINDSEKEILFNSISNACKAVELIIKGNTQYAMNEFN